MLTRSFFIFFSARVRYFSCVTFLTFVQIFVEFRKDICDSLSRFDGFAIFVFDFGDEDSFLHRFDTGDDPCSFEFFQDLLNSFLSCLPFVVSDTIFDLFADFTDSLFFMLRSRLPFLYEGQYFPSFPFVSCASGASVASAATAYLFVMDFPSAAAVNAAVAAAICSRAPASASVASFVVMPTMCRPDLKVPDLLRTTVIFENHDSRYLQFS